MGFRGDMITYNKSQHLLPQVPIIPSQSSCSGHMPGAMPTNIEGDSNSDYHLAADEVEMSMDPPWVVCSELQVHRSSLCFIGLAKQATKVRSQQGLNYQTQW
jgi:hypothetical protein